MKLLLRRNISKLGIIGDIVEVKNGYARNYLIPYGLATQPTEKNIQAVEAEKAAYLDQLAKEKAVLEAQAATVRGKEITISSRANEQGHLYGSIGPAQIVAALAQENLFVEPEYIRLDEPIRQLDKYDVKVEFAEDVSAMIQVWVVRIHEEGEEGLEGADQAPVEEADEAEAAPEAEPDPQQPAE